MKKLTDPKIAPVSCLKRVLDHGHGGVIKSLGDLLNVRNEATVLGSSLESTGLSSSKRKTARRQL